MAGGSASLEAAYRNAAITCGAMAASTLLYAVAAAVVSISRAPFEGFAGQTQPAGFRLALWTIAVVVAGLIGVVRKAVLGLVLFMLSAMRADFYVLFVLSLVLQAVYFPRLEGWRQWATEPALGC